MDNNKIKKGDIVRIYDGSLAKVVNIENGIAEVEVKVTEQIPTKELLNMTDSRLPFNHFMMWCRNWYIWDDADGNIIKQAQHAFELDGYLPDNDAVGLSLKAYEAITQCLLPWRSSDTPTWDLVNEIKEYCQYPYNCSIDHAIIMAVRNILGKHRIGDYDLFIAPQGKNGLKWNTNEFWTEANIKERFEIDELV